VDWNGRKVIIIGAARQGLALARYLASRGAQVVLTDRRSAADLEVEMESLADLPVEWAPGGHPLSLLDGADLVCPSGGVPLTLPLVEAARQRGIPLSNDSQIFLEQAPCPVIGITGSAGKTTTTTLVGRMAQAELAQTAGSFSRTAWVGGNIGRPLITALDDMSSSDLAVMELSSFQLELMTRSPQVAAVLNITPNHLDRHATLEEYTAAKARILDFQERGDTAVLGREDPGSWALRERVRGQLLSFGLGEPPAGQPGVFVMGNRLVLRQGKMDTTLMDRALVQLRGEHNLLNVLAACAIAAATGWSEAAMQAGVRDFTGVPHRLDFVRTWNGAHWYNDSIATAPERALAAVRSFDEPLVLLAGGRDKNLPWQDFAVEVSRRVRRLILFGEAGALIEQAFQAAGVHSAVPITRCDNLQQAVVAAAQLVEPGDVVLLSPGGTSFDEFKDFEERGECFAQWVHALP
jgi:UDP-N-acetylmuramoylalanine--D-glutamate ligase